MVPIAMCAAAIAVTLYKKFVAIAEKRESRKKWRQRLLISLSAAFHPMRMQPRRTKRRQEFQKQRLPKLQRDCPDDSQCDAYRISLLVGVAFLFAA
jgi:tRNA(Arg) A34 adenosine deaminase TadA